MMPTILVIEGLGNGHYIEKYLVSALVKKYPGLDIKYLSFAATPELAIPFIPKLILSHSFGSQESIDLAEKIGCPLITMDPRHPNYLMSMLDVFFPIWKPFEFKGKGKAYNFYRPSGILPGYRVNGAENTIVGGSHPNVPSLPEVFRLACKLIEVMNG